MVKISDDGANDEFGLEDIPCLVYFENGVPQIFSGINDQLVNHIHSHVKSI